MYIYILVCYNLNIIDYRYSSPEIQSTNKNMSGKKEDKLDVRKQGLRDSISMWENRQKEQVVQKM